MSTPTKRIAFHTLGCKLNFSETATISREFIRQGFEKVSYRDVADIYVLNTCSVTENADKEARKLIRQAKRKNPHAAVAVIGCYAQLKPKAIAEIDGVSLVLGAEEKFNLLHYLDTLELNGGTKVIQSDIQHVQNFSPSYSSNERTRSFLKIQDGCDYSCSFCTIPMARGKSRSDSLENTLALARQIARTDTREIVLTGVNIGDFGTVRGESFLCLLQELDKLNGIDRFRISSIEPNLLTDEIIEFCAASKKFMPHFHVPLQSGSNKILSAMRRRYTKEFYSNRVEKIKKSLPKACIGVDVIVGFPGELESDFMETYSFLHELDISYLHVFTYSERSNTYALEINNPVQKEERAVRSKKLHILSDKKRHAFQENYVGKIRQVLFESVKSDYLTGYTDNYIQVRVPGKSNLRNTICKVRLDANHSSWMHGSLID